MGGFPSLPMVPNQKQFEQPWAMSAVPQQQLAPSQVQRPNLNAFDANDGPESKWMDEFITSMLCAVPEECSSDTQC